MVKYRTRAAYAPASGGVRISFGFRTRLPVDRPTHRRRTDGREATDRRRLLCTGIYSLREIVSAVGSHRM